MNSAIFKPRWHWRAAAWRCWRCRSMGRFGCWNPRVGGGRFCGRPRSETRRRSGTGSTLTPTMCRWRATMARWRTPTYLPATWLTFPGRTRPHRCSLLGIRRGSPPRSSTAWDRIIFPRRKTIRECQALPLCWEAPTLTCANTLSSRPSRSCGGQPLRLGMLCKTHVARNVLVECSRARIQVATAAIYPINARRWFNAEVDACWFTLTIDPALPQGNYAIDVHETYSKAPARLPAVGVLSGPRSCRILMPTSWFAPPTALVPIRGGLA